MARTRRRTRRTVYARKLRGATTRRFARKFKRRKVYRGLLAAGVGKHRRRGRVRFMFNKRRRRFRSNPGSVIAGMRLPFGLQAPALTDIAFGAAGLFVPGMIQSKVLPYLPTSIMSGTLGTVASWLVKVASVLVPGMLIKKYVNPRAGYAFMIGGTASLAIDAIKTFLPSVASTIGLGYYPGGVVLGQYLGQSSQPLLGRYTDVKQRRVPVTLTPVMTGVPDRLNPASRF